MKLKFYDTVDRVTRVNWPVYLWYFLSMAALLVGMYLGWADYRSSVIFYSMIPTNKVAAWMAGIVGLMPQLGTYVMAALAANKKDLRVPFTLVIVLLNAYDIFTDVVFKATVGGVLVKAYLPYAIPESFFVYFVGSELFVIIGATGMSLFYSRFKDQLDRDLFSKSKARSTSGYAQPVANPRKGQYNTSNRPPGYGAQAVMVGGSNGHFPQSIATDDE